MRKINALLLVGFATIFFSCSNKKESPKEKMLFDGPSLIGQTAEDVRLVLGSPVMEDTLSKVQEDMSMPSDKYYQVGGYDIIVSFDPYLKTASEIFVSDTLGEVENTDALKQISGSDHDQERVVIKSIPVLRNKSLYTGITISRK